MEAKREIVYLKVDELIPYINNPRDNSLAVDAVASSIKNFGFNQPIVVDKNKEVIVGHTRLLAAKKIGLESIPVIIAKNLDDAKAKAYRLADNKVSELATWDQEMLAMELEELGLIDIDMTEFGFADDEVQGFNLGDVVIDEPEIDVSDDIITYVKPGDVFKLGRHFLMCGDSTSDDVDTLIDGNVIDLYITDPPYNVAYTEKTYSGTNNKSRKHNKIANDDMPKEEFEEFLFKAFFRSCDYLKLGGCFYIWYSSSSSLEFRNACQRAELDVRQTLIWEKNAIVLGRQDYQHKYEPCLYGLKNNGEELQSDYEPIFYGWKTGQAHNWNNDRKQSDILAFNKPLINDIHPTMKPVELFDYLIRNSTKKGDLVYDSFAGSGTSLIACENNGRTAYCMEYDPIYVQAIIERYQELTGTEAIKIKGDLKCLRK